MGRIRVLYLFRRPVIQSLSESKKGSFPIDYFFGFTELNNKFEKIVSDRVFTNKIVTGIDLLIIKLTYPFIHTGISFASVIYHYLDIKKANVIFATTDSYGLPLALFKCLGFVNKPIVINSGGLFDAVIKSKSKFYKKTISFLLKKVTFIISGVEHESDLFSKLFNLKRGKFINVNYGVDTNYFCPKNNIIGNYVLAVGADFTRDWDMYKQVALSLPKNKFIFVTIPNQINDTMPKNVEILYGIPVSEVRELMRKAQVVLILSKQNHRFAGQSTIFRAMSCAKTVIFSESHGVNKLPLRNFTNCIIVPPNNKNAVIKNIKMLSVNKKLNQKIARSARVYILKNNNYRKYTKDLENIFINSLNEKIN